MPYMNVDEIDSALVNLAAAYPSLSTLIELAEPSIEGRVCRALRIGTAPSGERDGLMLIGGQHAREWGSCDILVNLAADLLEAYDTDAGLLYGNVSYSAQQVRRLVDELEIVVFPMVNPDGRLFSQTEDQGGWRRNRNPESSGGDPKCIGVDLNRNYDFVWDFQTTFSPDSHPSVNADPCNDEAQTFPGTGPFSEPETRNVRSLLDCFPRLQWFFDVHCFSGFVLHNFADDEIQTSDPAMDFQNSAFDGVRGVPGDDAYGEFAPAADRDAFVALAHSMRQGIAAVRGHSYIVKSFFQMYPAPGTAADYVWSRHRVDPSVGKIFGYTLEWGLRTMVGFQPSFDEMEEIIRDVCSGILSFGLATFSEANSTVQLDTQELNFADVPAGVTVSRALVFDVDGTGGATLQALPPTLVSGSGTFFLPNLSQQDPDGPVTQTVGVPPTDASDLRQGRFWVSFTAGTLGAVASGALTVTHLETGDQFTITLRANVVARTTVASVLVMDQSGSMRLTSGIPGRTRVEVLREAAPVFVELLGDADAVGIVRFDDEFHNAMRITVAGVPDSGAGRMAALDAIAAHAPNPEGQTSIGDGVFRATQMLDGATGFEEKAIVVFTDGFENRERFLTDISDLINDRVFAIGLGTADQTDPIALNTITDSSGGFLLLTGNYGIDDRFRLSKYFLQVLVGVTNQQIIVDPDGYLGPGREARIPVFVTRADSEFGVVLLSPFPKAFDFVLEAPNGTRLSASAGGTVFRQGTKLTYYRTQLPARVAGEAAHSGRWHALLTVRPNLFSEYLEKLWKSKDEGEARVVGAHGIPWSLSAYAQSNLRLSPRVIEMGAAPNASIALHAVLTEYDIPVTRRARVVADVQRPDNLSMRVDLREGEPGVFTGSFVAALNGVYHLRFRAHGTTLNGFPFTREALRTAALWKGSSHKPPSSKKG